MRLVLLLLLRRGHGHLGLVRVAIGEMDVIQETIVVVRLMALGTRRVKRGYVLVYVLTL